MGVLPSSLVGLCHGQSHLEMDADYDDWGTPFQKFPYYTSLAMVPRGTTLWPEQIGIPLTRLKRDPSAVLTSYSAEIRLGQIRRVLHDQHPEVCILIPVFCYGNADFPRHCSPKSDDRAFFFRGLLMKWSWVETTRLVTRRWPISMLKGDIQCGKKHGS